MARTKTIPKSGADQAKEQKDSMKVDHFKATGGVKKPHRWRPGTVALRDIKRYQSGKKACDLLIPRASMNRLIAEIANDFASDGIMLQARAKEALHIAAEDFLTEQFRNINKLAIGRKGKTVTPRDLKLLNSLRDTA